MAGSFICRGWLHCAGMFIGALMLVSCHSAGAAPQEPRLTSIPIMMPTEIRTTALQPAPAVQIAGTVETATATAPASQTPAILAPVNFTPTPHENLPAVSLPSEVCSPLQDHTWTDLQEIVTNPFQPPAAGQDSGHHGVDFAYYRRGDRLSIEGLTVQSAMDGQVAAVTGNNPPYGNMVIVETAFEHLPEAMAGELNISQGVSLYMLYAHMQDIPLVSLGEAVACGQALGNVGNTPAGWSSARTILFALVRLMRSTSRICWRLRSRV